MFYFPEKKRDISNTQSFPKPCTHLKPHNENDHRYVVAAV